MTRTNDAENEVQDTADPPGRASPDGETQAQLYDTVGPSMDRRSLLKGIGAAGAAATLGTGTVAADHGSDDPIGDAGSDTSTSDGDDGVGTGEAIARASSGAAIGAMIAGPPGAVVGSTAGATTAYVPELENWLFGDDESRRLTQLQADIYAHANTTSNQNAWTLKELDKRLAVSKNNWIAQAQFDVINAINNDESEASATAAGVDGVLEAAANVQANLLAIESAAIVRYASFDARENEAGITMPDQAVQPVGSALSGEEIVVKGVKPIHVKLVNGDTAQGWALHVLHKGTDAGDVERIIHTHAYKQQSIINTTDTNAPALPIPETEMWELVDELSYNDSAGRIEYTDPDTGTTIRAGGGIPGGNRPFHVYAPDNIDGVTVDTALFEPADMGELSGVSTEGLIEYWRTTVYPLISTLASEIETYASDVYTAVESGEITTDDLMTPAIYAEELARDWAQSGDTGYSRALLSQLGIDTDLETSMTVTVAPSESPETTLNYGAIGETATFDHMLSNTDSASVTVVLDPGGASDGSGTMHVPGGTATCNVRVQGFSDDPSSPSYVVQDVTLTTTAGDTVTVPVSENQSLDGTIASGEAWYDDLDPDGDGSVTISGVDVTYATRSTASDGTTSTSQYTETAASGAGLAIEIDASGVGWTYQDAAIATDWRPHGGDPDGWSTAARKKWTFAGVTLTDTTNSDTVDVTAGTAHDGEPVVNDSAPDTYTVPSSRSLTLQLSGTLTNVNSVKVTTAAGDTYTATPSSGVASIPHTDIAAAGSSYTIDTISVEYSNSSGGTSTTTAGTVGAEFAVTDVTLPEYDFMTGRWYHTDNKGSDDQIVIATTGGDWVDIETGDVFRIESATDAQGNSLQGVTLSDTNRHSLDVSRVEEEVTRAIETQQTIEDNTEDPTPPGGGGGGAGGSMGLLGVILGGGALAWAYQHLTDGDG
ncbi:hypothetical protein [Halostella pelagica]|uniref:hypothetical protein n=1 Tax=Halostella pelagica TaxID=2583824 RepID=UPI00108040BA|nr:hypothetical protein [Halostella pelagica]